MAETIGAHNLCKVTTFYLKIQNLQEICFGISMYAGVSWDRCLARKGIMA